MNESQQLAQFFEFINQPKFHSIVEEELFLTFLNKVYSNLDEMVNMAFSKEDLDEDSFRKCRNKLLDALKRDFLADLQSVEPDEPEVDSTANKSRFNEALSSINNITNN